MLKKKFEKANSEGNVYCVADIRSHSKVVALPVLFSAVAPPHNVKGACSCDLPISSPRTRDRVLRRSLCRRVTKSTIYIRTFRKFILHLHVQGFVYFTSI